MGQGNFLGDKQSEANVCRPATDRRVISESRKRLKDRPQMRFGDSRPKVMDLQYDIVAIFLEVERYGLVFIPVLHRIVDEVCHGLA